MLAAGLWLQTLHFDGGRAFEHASRQVGLGPRPPGTAAHAAVIEYISQTLRAAGLQPSLQTFEASTPRGRFTMTNILATLPATAPIEPGKMVVVAAHYDTKRFDDFPFVGANDGASGTAVLLELARALRQDSRPYDTVLAFLDGEEAEREWTASDSLYGSRYLADAWQREGRIGRIKAFLLVDMVGARTLSLIDDNYSTPQLRQYLHEEAARHHLTRILSGQSMSVEDDHLPFVNRGVPSVLLIDFNYRPWHTREDTLDKISPHSLQAVGRLVEAAVMDMKRDGSPR